MKRYLLNHVAFRPGYGSYVVYDTVPGLEVFQGTFNECERTIKRLEAIDADEARIAYEARDKLVTKAIGIGPGETLRIELPDDLKF